MATVKSLSEIMNPNTVGVGGGCDTCGNETQGKVKRVAVHTAETLAKLGAKKPSPETQPVLDKKPTAQPAPEQKPAPQPMGNKGPFTPNKK